MGLNLRLFWTCLKTMHRIKAGENLRYMELIGMPNVSQEDRKSYAERQQEKIGTTTISDERDEAGIAKLRQLM